MWKKVEYSQKQSKKRCADDKQHKSLSKAHIQELNAVNTDDVPSRSAVKRLAKEIRTYGNVIAKTYMTHQRASNDGATPPEGTATTDLAFFKTLFDSIRSFLSATWSNAIVHGGDGALPVLNVELIGLGIGRFARRESPVAFLQMALFVALKLVVAHWATETARGEQRTARVEVHTRFFDPACLPIHCACCAELGIEVDKVNRYGAYPPPPADTAHLFFMPHCPWVLLHNVVASLWPSAPTTAGCGAGAEGTTGAAGAAVSALRRVAIVGNDLRAAPVLPVEEGKKNPVKLCLYSEGVLSALQSVCLLDVDGMALKGKPRSGKISFGTMAKPKQETEATEEQMVLSGFSHYEFDEAFDQLALVTADATKTDAEVQQLLWLVSKTPPVIVKRSPELL